MDRDRCEPFGGLPAISIGILLRRHAPLEGGGTAKSPALHVFLVAESKRLIALRDRQIGAGWRRAHGRRLHRRWRHAGRRRWRRDFLGSRAAIPDQKRGRAPAAEL